MKIPWIVKELARSSTLLSAYTFFLITDVQKQLCQSVRTNQCPLMLKIPVRNHTQLALFQNRMHNNDSPSRHTTTYAGAHSHKLNQVPELFARLTEYSAKYLKKRK